LDLGNQRKQSYYQFSANSGVSELLSNKYETDALSELSIFLDYMDPLFSMIGRKINNFAQKQVADAGKRKRKDNR
jgi:hypothetical protein